MSSDAIAGQLPPERNEEIFRRDIVRDYLPDDLASVARPRLILLGGQPGAGKTAVLTASHAELERDGAAIRIVGDDLRSYHPRFLAFQKADAETASRHTQADAGRWTEKLLAAATERRVSVVFETTMRQPENVERVVRSARAAGYEIDVRAVAVNPRVSWQGNHARFEEMLHAGVPARIPPEAIHDAAVTGLRATLGRLEQAQLVDRVELHGRNGTVLYRNDVVDGRWTHAAGAAEALEREQTRPLTRSELERFAGDWSHILMRMAARGAAADRVAAVEARAADDLTALLARQRQADGAAAAHRGRTHLPGSPVPDLDLGVSRREIGRGRGTGDGREDGPLVPARHLPDLEVGEIDRRLANAQRLAARRAEIEDLSRLVYGNGLAVSEAVQGIDNARTGAAAGDDVRAGKFGEMAGEGKGWLRGPSPERQTAEANAPKLAAALADYGLAVDFERHQILAQHRDEQARQRQEIPRPSLQLASALATAGEEQVRRFTTDAQTRRELDQLALAFNRRFSAEERAVLKAGQLDRAATAMRVRPEQAPELKRVQEQVDVAQRHLRAPSREVALGRAIDATKR